MDPTHTQIYKDTIKLLHPEITDNLQIIKKISEVFEVDIHIEDLQFLENIETEDMILQAKNLGINY